MENKKRLKMPGATTILVILLILIALLTYVIPAGEFARVPGPDGREMVNPDEFYFVEPDPTSLLGLLSAIPRGFVEASPVIAFTLIIAGVIAVIKEAGVLEVLVSKLSVKFSNNGILIIPVLMIAFSLIAAFIGTQELTMVYVPIIMPLIISLGFNSMVAVAIALVSSGIGFTSAFTNPFTVGISHQIAGLPMFSGMWFRIIVYLIMLPIGIYYVMKYARTVQTKPEEEMRKASEKENISQSSATTKDLEFTTRHKVISVIFVVFFAYMIYGVLSYGWGMIEMAGIFVGIGILSGLVAGMNGDAISHSFVEGAKGVLAGAILIGVANGVAVLMTDARILDTIVYYLGEILQTLPAVLNGIGIFIIQTFLNFLVPSGSGKALVTMPIISPLADLVGLNQQVAVLAFQLGDGLTNVLWPTSGAFMATLALGNVRFGDWVKFYIKPLIVLSIVSMILIVVAQAINLGPF